MGMLSKWLVILDTTEQVFIAENIGEVKKQMDQFCKMRGIKRGDFIIYRLEVMGNGKL